ncbi:Glycerophosphodiester phosphodiesterase GDPD1 chloroplastic [Bienertia sinuspersici]
MALKAVHVSDVPNLDHVPENASLSLCSSRFSPKSGVDEGKLKAGKFMVIGHRGNGMNKLQSSDIRMKSFKENSILSFNTAASFNLDFVEFDVQGIVIEKRVTDLSLNEFLAYGPQKEAGKVSKPLLRKQKDGKILSWDVNNDDTLCTLQEAFDKVDPKLGFNIELKFDDHIVYQDDHIINVLQSVLQDRPIIFSTFQPDAALVVRKLQGTYPVFFLTNGGNEVYNDRVAYKALFPRLREFSETLVLNVPESVYLQHLMGINGVIVDFVQDITEAVDDLITPVKADTDEDVSSQGDKPQFSQTELSFLLKLIPELIQQ